MIARLATLCARLARALDHLARHLGHEPPRPAMPAPAPSRRHTRCRCRACIDHDAELIGARVVRVGNGGPAAKDGAA